jgi:predicted lipid-binding transport protein (Tim44 family)
LVGALTGALVGTLTGALVGTLTGALVGALTGTLVGALTGALVGALTSVLALVRLNRIANVWPRDWSRSDPRRSRAIDIAPTKDEPKTRRDNSFMMARAIDEREQCANQQTVVQTNWFVVHEMKILRFEISALGLVRLQLRFLALSICITLGSTVHI